MITNSPGTLVPEWFDPGSMTMQDALGAYLVDLLTEACKTTLENNPAMSGYAATEVRQGLPQNNPVDRRISLYVHPNDPDDTRNDIQWVDRPVEPKDGYGIQTDEIGGGQVWLRRFVVQIRVYLVLSAENREEARAIGEFVHQRALNAIQEHEDCYIQGDGETAFMLRAKRVNPYEGGGPPTTFIWQGKIWVEFLTERS